MSSRNRDRSVGFSSGGKEAAKKIGMQLVNLEQGTPAESIGAFTTEEKFVLKSLTALQGVLKKKSNALISALTLTLGSFSDKYFKFYSKGKYLAMFEKCPVLGDFPKDIISTGQIQSVKSEGSNDSSFTIKLRGDKELTLKACKAQEAMKWVSALRQVGEIYRNKFLEDDLVGANWEEGKVDPIVLNAIMEEIEGEYAIALQKATDYNQQLHAKGLFEFYTSFKEHIRKTRIMITAFEYASKDTKAKKSEVNSQDYEMPSSTSKFFGLMITEKSYQDENHTDINSLKVLTTSDIPLWMEFNDLYLYSLQDRNSGQDFSMKIESKDIIFFTPIPGGNATNHEKYSFVIETKDKLHFFSMKFATEVCNWMRILQRAKRSLDESFRIKNSSKLRNIDELLHYYRQKDLDSVYAYLNQFTDTIRSVMSSKASFPSQAAHTTAVLKDLNVLQTEFISIIEAASMVRPFYSDLMRYLLENTHEIFTLMIGAYFNSDITATLRGSDLLELSTIMYRQHRDMEKYNMTDERYKNTIVDMTKGMCVQTYLNLLPVLSTLLTKMQSEHSTESSGVCVSYGPGDLFKFLNQVYDSALSCPMPAVISVILGLIYKLVNVFQREFKTVILTENNMSMEVFCALTNTNLKFIQCSRQFLDKIKSSCVLKEDEIMQQLGYNSLMKGFAQISTTAMSRIEQLVLTTIEGSFAKAKEGPFMQIKLEEIINQILNSTAPILTMLLPAYSKRLKKYICDSIALIYSATVISSLKMDDPNKKKGLLDTFNSMTRKDSGIPTYPTLEEFQVKFQGDIQLLRDLCNEALGSKENDARKSCPPERSKPIQIKQPTEDGFKVMELFNQMVKSPRHSIVEFGIEIAKILKLRYDPAFYTWLKTVKPKEFTAQEAVELDIIISSKNIVNGGRRDLLLEFYKYTMKEYNAYRFLRQLRERIYKYRVKRATQAKLLVDSHITTFSILDMETEACQLKGHLKLSIINLPAENLQPEAVISFLKKLPDSSQEVYACVKESMLEIKKAPEKTSALMRLKLSDLRNILLVPIQPECFVFSVGKSLYLFKTESMNSSPKWMKCLQFLQEMHSTEAATVGSVKKFEFKNGACAQNKILDLPDYLARAENYDKGLSSVKSKTSGENNSKCTVEVMSDSDDENTTKGKKPF
jgi:hypothetical protein